MPDQPPTKRTYDRINAGDRPGQGPRYAELHCRTNFSFLEGASHPDELVRRAVELEYHALAITDRNSLAGVVRAHTAARETRLKLLIGAEITPTDLAPVVLLATDRTSYGRLARLITRGRRRAPKGECQLAFDDIDSHADGLIACVCCPPAEDDRLAATYSRYREVFDDRCYALAELAHSADDYQRLIRLHQATRQARVPMVAANNVHYHERQRQVLHDVLTAIRLGRPVVELGDEIFPNAERHLKTADEMLQLLSMSAGPDPRVLLQRTVEIADRCHFSLDELRYEYPEELCPAGTTPLEHLRRLSWMGARKRYPAGVPDKVRRLLEYELELISELRYEAYFLTVWDLVRFARQRGILCQGRGSAANSVVCFCLEVTSVDPDRIDVLFERFVSKERNEAPDIDVDFEHERREEVLQYIYDKYGRDRAAMTAEVITYRPRSAVRDVGKALGLSLDRVDALAKRLENYNEDDKLARRVRDAGVDPTGHLGRHLLELVRQILGFPRHLSQHVGGMVMTRSDLCELVPIENAAMPDRTVIQWDKDDLDSLGILKVDCLALGMLTAIRKCFQLIAQSTGERLNLASVPAEDDGVYEMIQRADTIGVFQIESRAQMSMLPRLRPRCFYDLVIEVAIVRPGPIQGDMVHPYLRRRRGEEEVEFPNDHIRDVLSKTLGVPIFQEQAMRLAVVAAGFSPGEADQLRRAMGAWRRPGVIDQFHRKLIEGMESRGYSSDFAERLFRQIRGFGEYGFPESHAASFALLVYVSAWIKRYHPAAFTAALLNSQPMGFYAPAQLVADARNHGIEVRPADINLSDWDCTLECEPSDEGGPPVVALRLGLRLIRGLSVSVVQPLLEARKQKPFRTIHEFTRRTNIRRSTLTRLAKADALRSLQRKRREAIWESLPAPEPWPLKTGEPPEQHVDLPQQSAAAEVVADYQTSGLSLRAHPFQFLRPQLASKRIVTAERLKQLPAGRWVKVAGLVLLRQRPSTASGITFVTLEDETGMANLIVRPEIWERHHLAARTAHALLATGSIQREGDVIHVYCERLENLSRQLAELPQQSRDFR